MNLFKKPLSLVQSIFLIIAIVVSSSLVLYIPFLFNLVSYLGFHNIQTSMLTIYQNYDGVLYIVPAKTFYNIEAIQSLRLEQSLPDIYYAAHLPLYPFFIRVFAFVFDYLPSMIITNIFFSAVLGVLFYWIVRKFKVAEHPLILTVVFLFLPRFLVARSVGAPESLFILLILGSVFFFEKKNYFFAGYLGGLAAMTKVPGVLLFPAFCLVILEQIIREKKFRWDSLFILLIPVGLLGVFWLYQIQYEDFFAYFHTGGVVPMPYPFSAFNFQAKWVDTAWLEDIILYMFLYLYSIISLRDSKYRSFFYFPLVFFTATIFVQHRDLSRYLLPLWPFACIALQQTFTSKKFLIAAIILLPAIYLYAVNYLLFNTLPISDWRPFL